MSTAENHRGHANNQKIISPQTIRPLSASERDDAMNVIVGLEQRRRLVNHDLQKLVPKVVTVKLNNYRFEVYHTVVGGRIKN